MHEPWRIVLLTVPDGSTVMMRVWLPPLSDVDGAPEGPGTDRHVVLPAQRPRVPTAEQGSA
jgi:hypothetical protein